MTDKREKDKPDPMRESTEDAMRRLFPREAVEAAKREAEKAKSRIDKLDSK
jgi:outer membrane murein-binding lipoprotein Lpp